VAVTGSAGKTTAKEFLAAICPNLADIEKLQEFQ
jgi:UDP-N-acetylmuramyl pentapeptide synthase